MSAYGYLGACVRVLVLAVLVCCPGGGLSVPWPALAAGAVAASACAPTGTEPGAALWHALEPGLCLARLQCATPAVTLVALRVDPGVFRLALHMRSQEGGAPKNLRQWAEANALTVAINASMYLPDQRTSIGYMRASGHVNNPRVGERLGVFLVAEPDDPTLPMAQLLEKSDPHWQATLARYRLVVQNFRLVGDNRRILWPEGGTATSIAAIAQDGNGRILFLHCREPLTPHAFARLLLDAPLGIVKAMYVEGGAEAGMLLRQQKPTARTHLWLGRSRLPFWSGEGFLPPLPNVLGVRPREGSSGLGAENLSEE